MSKHTPGPWHVRPDGGIDGGGGTVVQPGAISWSPDALLVAAAPDLLEALRVMLTVHDFGGGAESHVFGPHEAARRAIAKAEGEQP